MSNITRRNFIKVISSSVAVAGLAGFHEIGLGSSSGRVVVVGGGYGGATAAKYLRLIDPNIHVTLIEKNAQYVSCPMSNEVISGVRDINSLKVSYSTLGTRYGINVVQAQVTEIDPVKKNVRTANGQDFQYDRLIVSPGIDFRWNAIDGYDRNAVEIMPHAWRAGPQTLLLRHQLEAMKDGGVVIIVAPPGPFKCPPGPYERASLIAYYLKQHKPRSKILILDYKDKFSKQALFEQGWAQHYPGMITWIAGSMDGHVNRVAPYNMKVFTDFEEYKGDVINVIPPQQAGEIARRTGLADKSGWCPVNQKTFESKLYKEVHVIGDASIAGKMPKSAYAANSQGKVCAAAVAALINGKVVEEPSYINTCYSLVTPKHGISVAAVYELNDKGRIVEIEEAGDPSPIEASPWQREMEARYAHSFLINIMSDTFG
ncbi:MAG: cytochrome C [Gammaproteobacteria bacterium]|nr:MAG: cytochrome C [Gammaproteobacteria bacterium]RKZ42841.1 MAG: cytochrome C [Gammaproteobacteria bacterium]RKZ72133.1 MAG: cytochrome C [Gammaproteobacteria bacterium]